jgi:hypothetical protein
MHIKSDVDVELFQADVNIITDWLSLNKLHLSKEKSGLLRLGRHFRQNLTTESPYFVDGYQVNEIPELEFRDLGVAIDEKLNFTSHITKIANKSNSRSHCMNTTFKTNKNDFKLQMYKTFCRPIQEFCSSIWLPHSGELLKRFENPQRKFTKYSYGLFDKSYLERCKTLKLEPMVLRKLKYDLTIMYKLTHNYFLHLSPADFVTYKKTSNTRTKHNYVIEKERTRSKVRSSFLVPRICDIWNDLDSNIVHAKSVKDFKNGLETENEKLLDHINRSWPSLLS